MARPKSDLKQVLIRLYPEQINKLDAMSKQAGIDRTTMIRFLLQAQIDKSCSVAPHELLK